MSSASAAGRESEPFRPRKEVRSPVAERSPSLAWAKATRPANSWFQAFVARIAPVAASCAVTTCWLWPACGGPEHPLGVGEDGEAPGRPPSFVSVSSESFTGSTASTNTSSALRMPLVARAKRVTPAPWRITNRPLAPSRGSGPGVGDHASPLSSSRTRMASEVGSVTGSFANGVRRFSRLFSDQVKAEPDAVTTVPKAGLAMTFAQGSGVSWSPSRTMTYSRPPSAKPPIPFASASGGTSGWAIGASAGAGLAGGASSSGAGSGEGGRGRSSWCARDPRSPERTARATPERRRRSASAIRSARRRYAPPGRCFHVRQGPSSRRAASWACTSSR